MQTFQAWMNSLNGIVWGPAMLVLILGTGLYLQLRLAGMPIRRIGSGLRLVNVNSHINDIFMYSGFDKLFQIEVAG